MATSAAKIIDAFGGHAEVSQLLGLHVSGVYRWTYPKDSGGTGGKIPTKYQDALLKAAIEKGVPIKAEDFFNIDAG